MFSVNRTTALRPGKPLMAFTTSVVFVGNLDGDIETIVRTSNLFYPMPKEMDTAFYDRIHAYMPGWEFQKTHDDIYTNHFGLVTDYLAEVFKEVHRMGAGLPRTLSGAASGYSSQGHRASKGRSRSLLTKPRRRLRSGSRRL